MPTVFRLSDYMFVKFSQIQSCLTTQQGWLNTVLYSYRTLCLQSRLTTGLSDSYLTLFDCKAVNKEVHVVI